MDDKHRELIRSNYTKLIAVLRKDDAVGNVCNFLLEKAIITRSMKDKVLCQKTPVRQSSDLLDLLPNRGRRAFGALYEACKQNGLNDAADILEPDKAPHLLSKVKGSIVAASVTEEELPLPEKWPTKEHFERVSEKKLRVKTVSRDAKSSMLERYQTHLNTDTIYRMCHKNRGNALIILNENFPTTELLKRVGSKWDKKGLKQLFHGLGFGQVTVKKNLAKKRIYEVIETEISQDHTDHDCFAFFIMSYGRCGIVFDTKKEAVSIRSIVNLINEAESLKNIPKLLFFQACQREKSASGDSTVRQPQSEGDEELDTHDSGAQQGEETLSIPDYPDVFVFRSSPDGALSYRNTDWGSWFTQAIIYVFSEYAYKCELQELLLMVNDLLSRAETVVGGFKNVGEFGFVPGKKFFFFPGLYDSKTETS